MCWCSKLGQDRSKKVKMSVEFTQAQTRGVARGTGTVLFVLNIREVVITSVLDEDPSCVGVGGYARYHLSD